MIMADQEQRKVDILRRRSIVLYQRIEPRVRLVGNNEYWTEQ
jgi:hypothetical protein